MAPEPGSPPVDERFLHEIISTVGSSLELEQVLAAVVDLLSEASAVHACFVYLQDRDGARLVLRAASPPYGGLVGQIVLERPEGLAWWAIEQRRAAFIRDHALDDPRVKYVPELEEERFQSLVAIPLLGRRGDAMGAITLDTAAPREFTDSEVELFVSTASLVAGAIENARLYAEMRLRVAELEGLTELAGAVAATEELDTLGRLVVARSLRAAVRRLGPPLPLGRRRRSACGSAGPSRRASRRPGHDRRRRARPRAAPRRRARASPSRSSPTASCSARSSRRARGRPSSPAPSPTRRRSR